MEKEEMENYRKAGKIIAGIKSDFLKKMQPGNKILDVAEEIEQRIIKEGGKPTFPVNVSINEIAAHYTPVFGDSKTIEAGDLVKVDLGAQVDGYIADSAFTYCSEKSRLTEIAEKAVGEAIKILREGITVAEIGTVIEDFVKSQGIGLIINLTGHGIQKDVFHGQPTIFNVKNGMQTKLKDGDVIAIEPFVAESTSSVKDSGQTEIYRFLANKPVRSQDARNILDFVRKTYGPYPFAKRWLAKEFGQLKAYMAIRQLDSVGALEAFPVLRDSGKKPIAQAEHTIIITKGKPIVLTKLED